jgi:uridylate kinase
MLLHTVVKSLRPLQYEGCDIFVVNYGSGSIYRESQKSALHLDGSDTRVFRQVAMKLL